MRGADAGSELVVTKVQEGSPAALAGMLVGDQLLTIDDSPLVTVDDLWSALVRYNPDDVVTVGVQRDQAMLTLTVTLGARPS